MKTKYFYFLLFLIISMMIGSSSYFKSLNITLSSTEFVLSLLNIILCFIISYTSYIIHEIWKDNI